MSARQVKITEYGVVQTMEGRSVSCHRLRVIREDGYIVSCNKSCASFMIKNNDSGDRVWCMADNFIVGVME